MTTRGNNAVRQLLQLDGQSELTVELSWCGLTHVGHRREVNQDSYVAVPPVFAVADGMGGHAAGEIASAAVARRLSELGPGPVNHQQIELALNEAIEDIELNANEIELGTGSTVTGLVLDISEGQPSWSVFNIGDSRVYQFFQDTLTQLTVDHSVVQHLIDTGQITPEEAEFHPHSNVITRAVGMTEDPVPDYSHVGLAAGQRMLICSDGLTKELTDSGIRHYLAEGGSAQQTAETLLREALANAGRDNITVLVIDVHAVGDSRETIEIEPV